MMHRFRVQALQDPPFCSSTEAAMYCRRHKKWFWGFPHLKKTSNFQARSKLRILQRKKRITDLCDAEAATAVSITTTQHFSQVAMATQTLLLYYKYNSQATTILYNGEPIYWRRE